MMRPVNTKTMKKLEPPKTSWNRMEEAGALSKQGATNCTKMELVTNWLKKARNSSEGNCARNTISQKDTKLAIVIVERNTTPDIHIYIRPNVVPVLHNNCCIDKFYAK